MNTERLIDIKKFVGNKGVRIGLATGMLFGAGSLGACKGSVARNALQYEPTQTSTVLAGQEKTATSTPTIVVTRVVDATATPTATQVPSGQRESVTDHEMKAGETYRAKDGSMIKGDVLVDGVRLFDDNERTGLIVELHRDADITAPWGANVSYVGMDQTTRNAVFGQGVEEMKAKGCVGGCDRVDVVKYPGGKPQGK